MIECQFHARRQSENVAARLDWTRPEKGRAPRDAHVVDSGY